MLRVSSDGLPCALFTSRGASPMICACWPASVSSRLPPPPMKIGGCGR